MKYYVFKLITPRPTFVADMTAEERVLMQAHAEYWQGLMTKGMVVIFGPVADPTRPYGLGIVRLEDGVDPESIWSVDPLIRANQGFRFEVALMLSAVIP
jgi:uncharacterized protein YciI